MAYEPELERLERRYQDDPARNFAQLAEAYRKVGRLDDALTMLQGHLSERPNYVSGLVVMGRCLLDQHNDAEARATFERVLAVDGEHIIALRALGEISERAGDLDGARQWFTRLLDIDPMNDDAEAAMARIKAAGATAAGTAEETTAETAGEATAGLAEEITAELADEIAAGVVEELPSEYVIEESSDAFMPRASAAKPMDVEQVGEVEISSQIPEEEPLIGGTAPAAEEPFAFPTGEQEVDLGFVEEPAATPAEPDATLEVQAFDDSLGWGTGDRISRSISRADLQEISESHEDTAPAVSELPGLETTEVPAGEATVEVGPVEGLEGDDAEDVIPIEGLQPTEAEAAMASPPTAEEPVAAAAPELEPEEPVTFVEPEALEIVHEETTPVVPEPQPVSEEAGFDASGEIMDRATAERRRSLMGLPLIDEEAAAAAAAEPEAPLVLEAEPEPVVTETMAELYVKQGLHDEARDVYERLLAQRPGDAKIQARLSELKAARKPAQAPSYAAASTGGQSVRGMMAQVLGMRPGMEGTAAEATAGTAPGGAAGTAGEETAAAAAAVAPEPMEEAFEEEAAAEEAMGAPTHPATDEVSLASVFGEAPPSKEPEPEAPPQGKENAPRAPGGFSFDDFFGKQAGEGGAAPRDSLADDEGEEAFRDWLKGLKG